MTKPQWEAVPIFTVNQTLEGYRVRWSIRDLIANTHFVYADYIKGSKTKCRTIAKAKAHELNKKEVYPGEKDEKE